MSDLSAQILSSCITKTAALRELSSVEDQVRSRKIKAEDYNAARDEIKAIEPLYFYLPFELPEEEILKISSKLRRDYGKQFLIETRVDPQLLGGCALSYKGVYKDYSLKDRLNKTKIS